MWLSAEKTSPFDFYQYWMGQDDRDVGMHAALADAARRGRDLRDRGAAARAPEQRPGQRELALLITARVHGEDEARRQAQVAEALFSGSAVEDPEVLEVLFPEVPHWEFSDEDLRLDAAGTAVASGLYASRSEATREIRQGGFSINGERMSEPTGAVPKPIDGRFLFARAARSASPSGGAAVWMVADLIGGVEDLLPGGSTTRRTPSGAVIAVARRPPVCDSGPPLRAWPTASARPWPRRRRSRVGPSSPGPARGRPR